jgi:hypothetical protein
MRLINLVNSFLSGFYASSDNQTRSLYDNMQTLTVQLHKEQHFLDAFSGMAFAVKELAKNVLSFLRN